MSLTWKQIEEASQAAGFFQGVMRAEENALQTIHVEEAAEPADHDRLALSTLQGLLACGSLARAEHDFFVQLGVEF